MTVSLDPAQSTPPPLSVMAHIGRSLTLSIPVMLARAGMIVMVSVDSIMTGRAGVEELAHYAISLAPHMTLLVVGIGLMVGTIVLTAQADGAGQRARGGAIWVTAIWMAGALGLLWAGVLMAGEPLLRLLGQSPSMAVGGGRALLMFAPGMPAILMYIATTFFLEGIGRPKAGMVVALSANLLNAALNWVLIYGHLGMPEMGGAGAALATTLTRWAMLAALVGYVLKLSDGPAYGLRQTAWPRPAVAVKLLRIGAPLSVASALETACFGLVMTFAGRLGEVPMAAYQIAFNVITFVFMLAIGISTATSVRVANAVGRGDRVGFGRAGWVGFGLAVTLMVAAAGLMAGFAPQIAALYSTEPAVRTLATHALWVAACVVVVDGAQAVLLGALRGAGDVIAPTLSFALAFWGVAVPAAYIFGLHGGAGILGLFWSLFAGLCVALVLLLWRFVLIARRGARPL